MIKVQGHIVVRRRARNGNDGVPGDNGLPGCILRQSEWVKGVEFRNDEALTSGTRYLDIAIVTTGANTFNAYKCLKTHTSSDSIPVTNTTYWQKFNSLQPVYTPLIMAQNAILRFMQGNQLLIMKADGKTVAAGLVGGDYPLWIGADTPSSAPYRVSLEGKLYASGATITGDSVFEGTIRGVSGSFKSLNCIDGDGNVVGGISFDNGKMWFDGDIYHQGQKNGRSLRFYTANVRCRGSLGFNGLNVVVVYGSYAYYYPNGYSESATRVYKSLTSKKTTNNTTYYVIDLYPQGNELDGCPFNAVVLYNTSATVTYRYVLDGFFAQPVYVFNANDSANDNTRIIYRDGKQINIRGGSGNIFFNLGSFMMYPKPDDSLVGVGWVRVAEYDNDWR